MDINTLTEVVIGLCIKIHSRIGPGCYERVYEEILYYELTKLGFKVERQVLLPIVYDDLLRFSGSINVYDKNDQDTLWIRVYYNEFERKEIDLNLKKIYSFLHSDGNLEIIKLIIYLSEPFSLNKPSINEVHENFSLSKSTFCENSFSL